MQFPGSFPDFAPKASLANNEAAGIVTIKTLAVDRVHNNYLLKKDSKIKMVSTPVRVSDCCVLDPCSQ